MGKSNTTDIVDVRDIETIWKDSEATLTQIDHCRENVVKELDKLKRFAEEAKNPESNLARSFKKTDRNDLELYLEENADIALVEESLEELEGEINKFKLPEIQVSDVTKLKPEPVPTQIAGKKPTDKRNNSILPQYSKIIERIKKDKESAKQSAQKFNESCKKCLEEMNEQYKHLKALNEALKQASDLQNWGPWIKQKLSNFIPEAILAIGSDVLPGLLRFVPQVIHLGYLGYKKYRSGK